MIARVVSTIAVLAALGIGARWSTANTSLDKLGSILPLLFVTAAVGLALSRTSSGDRPRRPWLLIGLANLILVASRPVGWWVAPGGAEIEWLVILSNAFMVVAVADAVAVVRSGSALLLDRLPKPAMVVLSSAAMLAGGAALWCIGRLLLRLIEAGWHGQPSDWTRVAAVFGLVCDATIFVLAIWLVATVIRLAPLGSSPLALPYLLLAVAAVLFLTLDLSAMFVVDDWGYVGLGPVLSSVGVVAWCVIATAAGEHWRMLRIAQT